jgi:hypothetical protein
MKGFMMYSALAFLAILLSLSGVQISWYRQKMISFQSEIDQDQAIILRNIVIANNLKKNNFIDLVDQPVLQTSTGFEVTLKNGRKIILNDPLATSK